MLIAIFGESCTGKSTLADKLSEKANAAVFTGKDYLRLAKNEAIARKLFQDRLRGALNGANFDLCHFSTGIPGIAPGRLHTSFGNSRFGYHQGTLCPAHARQSACPGGGHAGTQPWLLR